MLFLLRRAAAWRVAAIALSHSSKQSRTCLHGEGDQQGAAEVLWLGQHVCIVQGVSQQGA